MTKENKDVDDGFAEVAKVLHYNKPNAEGQRDEQKIEAVLEDADLWSKFSLFTNEMIVTKGGRRMFPVLRVSLRGLNPEEMYKIALEFRQVDDHKWKYLNGDWQPACKVDITRPNSVYIHPDSPNYGSYWMRESISFNKMKLTNRADCGGKIILNSLHKYEPKVIVLKVTGSLDEEVAAFPFPQARFIAVTAYQNERITSLKIRYNPFAKAFLDSKDKNAKNICCEKKDASEEINGPVWYNNFTNSLPGFDECDESIFPSSQQHLSNECSCFPPPVLEHTYADLKTLSSQTFNRQTQGNLPNYSWYNPMPYPDYQIGNFSARFQSPAFYGGSIWPSQGQIEYSELEDTYPGISRHR